MSEVATKKKEPERVYPQNNATYLQAAGWIPLGHPDDPTTRWLRPPTEEEVKRGIDPDKDWEEKVLVAKHVKQPNGSYEDTYQIKIHQRRQPMPIHEAVRKQMAKDGKIKTLSAGMADELTRAKKEFKEQQGAK